MGSNTIDYGSIAAKAEEAASKVKDIELRKVAFERILSSLLHECSPNDGVEPDNAISHAKTNKRSKKKPGNKKEGKASVRNGPIGYLKELVDDNFFSKQRAISDIKQELANRGHHLPRTALSGPLQRLAQAKLLRRQKGATSEEARSIYLYSNY